MREALLSALVPRGVRVLSVLVLAGLAGCRTSGPRGSSASPAPGVSSSSEPERGASVSASVSANPGGGSARRVAKPIPKIDIHAHVDLDVSGPARDLYRSYGVVRVVNLSGGVAGQGLEESLEAAKVSRGFYLVFANIDFSGIGGPSWASREVRRLEQAKALGAKGVKIAKNLGLGVRDTDGKRVPVDDPRLDPVFDAMGRLGLPLAIHTGDPKAFFDPVSSTNERLEELASHPSWSFADRGLFPSWQELFGEFERRVKRSRTTKFIGVHFGNAPEEPERVGKMLDECPNLYVDTAARVPELGRRPEVVRRVILAHADRVLFGTDLQAGAGMLVLGAGPARGHSQKDVDHFFDSTFRFFETEDRAFAHPTPIQGRWTIDGIALPDDVLEKIYHVNAEKLLGLPASERPTDAG